MKKLLILALSVFALGSTTVARGEDKPAVAGAAVEKKTDEAAPPAAQSGAKAEVKAATGIENRLPTGEATSFASGTLIYVWSQVTGAKDKEVEHVWKRDGKEFRRAKFSIGSARWNMNSRMPKAAKGNYLVEVVLGDEKLGEVTFVVE